MDLIFEVNSLQLKITGVIHHTKVLFTSGRWPMQLTRINVRFNIALDYLNVFIHYALIKL